MIGLAIGVNRSHQRAGAAALQLILILAALAMSAKWGVGSARAAQLYLLDGTVRNDPTQLFFTPVCNARLRGQIMPGDAERFQKRIADWPGTGRMQGGLGSDESGYRAICLESNGGDIQEAMKLARVLWDWMPVVEAATDCFSACAVLFMKIAPRDGTFSVNPYTGGRYLHFSGRLGFHAPRLDVRSVDPSSIDASVELASAYERALRTLGRLSYGDYAGKDPVGDDGQRFEEIGSRLAAQEEFFPVGLLIAILNTPPARLFVVDTLSQAMNWGIEVYGFPPPAKLTEKMLFTACVNVARVRCVNGGVRSQCLQIGSRAIHALHGVPTGEGWPVRKLDIWPATGAKGDLRIQTYRVERNKESLCDVQAIWHSGKLVDLNIITFNGKPLGWRNARPKRALLLEESWDLRMAENFRQKFAKRAHVELSQLRPMKLLPAGSKLHDLGRAPWAELGQDREFFDQPARWR